MLNQSGWVADRERGIVFVENDVYYREDREANINLRAILGKLFNELI